MLEIRWASATRGELPARDAWLGERERALVARMRGHARREAFRLGRFAAKRLLGAEVEVLPACDGAPCAHRADTQLPLTLSISHRAGLGVCASVAGEVALGCDIERVEPRSPAFLRDFLTPEEREAVATAADPAECANLIWSAKESALKALRVGLSRDTFELEVSIRQSASWDGTRVRIRRVSSVARETVGGEARLWDLSVTDRTCARMLCGAWGRLVLGTEAGAQQGSVSRAPATAAIRESYVLTVVCAA